MTAVSALRQIIEVAEESRPSSLRQERSRRRLIATLAREGIEAEALHRTRRGDHPTSLDGAEYVLHRAGSQWHRLLVAYNDHYAAGLTADQAAIATDLLAACYWKRCGELRTQGMIEPTGETRPGRAGAEQMVCRVTRAGRAELIRLGGL